MIIKVSSITSENYNLVVANLVEANPALCGVFFENGHASESAIRNRPENIQLADIDSFRRFYERTAGALLSSLKGIEDRILPAWLEEQLQGINNSVNGFAQSRAQLVTISDRFGKPSLQFLPPDASEHIFDRLLHTFGAISGSETEADLIYRPGINRSAIPVSLHLLSAGLVGTYRVPDSLAQNGQRQPRSLEFTVTLANIFSGNR